MLRKLRLGELKKMSKQCSYLEREIVRRGKMEPWIASKYEKLLVPFRFNWFENIEEKGIVEHTRERLLLLQEVLGCLPYRKELRDLRVGRKFQVEWIVNGKPEWHDIIIRKSEKFTIVYNVRNVNLHWPDPGWDVQVNKEEFRTWVEWMCRAPVKDRWFRKHSRVLFIR